MPPPPPPTPSKDLARTLCCTLYAIQLLVWVYKTEFSKHQAHEQVLQSSAHLQISYYNYAEIEK